MQTLQAPEWTALHWLVCLLASSPPIFRSRWLTRDLQLYCSQEVTQVHQGQTVQVSTPPRVSVSCVERGPFLLATKRADSHSRIISRSNPAETQNNIPTVKLRVVILWTTASLPLRPYLTESLLQDDAALQQPQPGTRHKKDRQFTGLCDYAGIIGQIAAAEAMNKPCAVPADRM
ncbi:hypothetical protein FVEG_14806 [Fusarium verticillioides 7600]|uniref:Uncharacterized protein n=1 Tax=Gibberella moniliformis (strain M3125 / FGSC 7600) TaxID=334819 RepID=W7LHA8_GIBM7|nr:hypothetical protein FVEG_14806 [Fusarium verticillioides 7600]XP_018744066.1 hypothetical protein FVEG_14806 [Fusarium verticillioides 7600]XP_018744067.1 hypothetical protein FVEG_14806 [Fusarium verticillioides 7600]XP_018744068.1 hypothetical protein FVEG_14806 [Fusarium verticillioides 7600]EWG37874.1 hypothetical protein FVEG_14806 [Fusarium verticillioides 7600]EWG37875.1 hypothetical protein FVEG_14806 [Fusarium verticillioides 7600]EWG37876.1 hypothetical protein FVEG_14806 [Fusar